MTLQSTISHSIALVALLGSAACDKTEPHGSKPVTPLPAASPMKPYLAYDFEEGRTLEVKPLSTNGKCRVDFMGITDEKAFRGGKSFKFEVTVESGTYFTWVIPFNVSTEGRLKMSYRYQVASTGKGKYGPEVSLHYPAIPSADGTDAFDWVNSTDGGWTLLDADLTAFAKARITSHNGGGYEIQPEQVLAEVKGMVICFSGTAPGERITLYLDDLVVEGDPQEVTEDFNRRAAELWGPVNAKHRVAIQKMRDSIQEDTRFLAAHAPPSHAATLFQESARARLEACSAIVTAATGRGYLLNKEVAVASQHDEAIRSLMANLSMLVGYDFSRSNDIKDSASCL